MGTENFASFYLRIPIAKTMCLNDGNPFLICLCTLADP